MRESTKTSLLGWACLAASAIATLLDFPFIAGPLLVAFFLFQWDAKHDRIQEELAEIKERLPK